MREQLEEIAPGFGARLREERSRLNKTQSDFAALAGIQRLAQRQYESEARSPNVRYLSAVGAIGVNLYYLMFAKRDLAQPLSAETQRDINKQVIQLIEDYVRQRCGGNLSADGRFILFEILHAHLTRAAQNGLEPDMTLLDSLVAR